MSELQSKDFRRCNACLQIKSISEFSDNGPYLRSYCKLCRNEENRYYKYKNRYKLDWLSAISILNKQDNKCKICNKSISMDDGSAHTDHDHETNKIRGFLCGNCNNLLGLAHDSIYILIKAAEYLCESS